MKTVLLILSMVTIAQTAISGNREIIHLWPGDVPGQSEPKAPPVIEYNKGDKNHHIIELTDPLMVVYEANPETRNGAAVIVCAGGGYNFLSIDKEGYEIAEWLSNLGYTAFVLHYRVPQKQEGSLQDMLRAIRYVRGNRDKWSIDANRIGGIGFSAGGNLCARAGTRFKETLYEPVDELDAVSARLDFVILLYPAYLDHGKNKSLSPELTLTADTPPMFLFVAANDKAYANSSLVMTSALREAEIPVELHVYPDGGHGFGMRERNLAGRTWPGLCEDWMQRTVFGK